MVSSHRPSITPAQRTLQSLGKPYDASTESGAGGGESYETHLAREQAASILDSGELLGWYAGARGESISQTRHYFGNILLGLKPPTVIFKEEWEIPAEQRKGSKKGKEAAAAGSSSGSGSSKEKGKGAMSIDNLLN